MNDLKLWVMSPKLRKESAVFGFRCYTQAKHMFRESAREIFTPERCTKQTWYII